MFNCPEHCGVRRASALLPAAEAHHIALWSTCRTGGETNSLLSASLTAAAISNLFMLRHLGACIDEREKLRVRVLLSPQSDASNVQTQHRDGLDLFSPLLQSINAVLCPAVPCAMQHGKAVSVRWWCALTTLDSVDECTHSCDLLTIGLSQCQAILRFFSFSRPLLCYL